MIVERSATLTPATVGKFSLIATSHSSLSNLMSTASEIDALLIQRIRSGDTDAWGELISRYEGRLLAFVESRLSNRAAGEDIVQETFIGFLNSLPNFDGQRPLESYLFSICA